MQDEMFKLAAYFIMFINLKKILFLRLIINFKINFFHV